MSKPDYDLAACVRAGLKAADSKLREVTRSSEWYYDRMELPHSFQVEREGSRDTGLVDPDGHPIYRSPNPVGFVTDFKAARAKPRVRVKAGRSQM